MFPAVHGPGGMDETTRASTGAGRDQFSAAVDLQCLFFDVEIGRVGAQNLNKNSPFKLLIAGDADPGDQFKGGEEEKSPLHTY